MVALLLGLHPNFIALQLTETGMRRGYGVSTDNIYAACGGRSPQSRIVLRARPHFGWDISNSLAQSRSQATRAKSRLGTRLLVYRYCIAIAH